MFDSTGILSEEVNKGIDIAINKIANEFDTRKLTELESDRVKDVMVMAVEKIEQNINNKKVVRNDNFFINSIDDRSDGEKIFEAIIISSQREAQKIKLKLYANLLANIGFQEDINNDEAMQIITFAERLTYRQCLLMIVILKKFLYAKMCWSYIEWD